MDPDDIGELSSFQTEQKQKGLLTFYQQQWIQNKQITREQPKVDALSNHRVQLKQIPKNSLVFRNISLNLDDQAIKPIKSHYTEKLRQNRPNIEIEKIVQINRINKPVKFCSLHQTKKQRQNKFQFIKENLLHKNQTYKKLRQSKRQYEQLHIKNYPFQDQEEEEFALGKIKSQVLNIRIRKGSSFKGFHRQIFVINPVNLSKDNVEPNYPASSGILTPIQNTYEPYFSQSKKISNYLFPVLAPENSFFQKSGIQKIQQNYEDSLSKICKKIRLKEQRNSDMPIKRQQELN